MLNICVIAAYFGQYPKYIDLWVKSCELNSSIDFYVVGDIALPREVKNIKHIAMNLQEFKERIQTTLKRQVVLDKPYKCCDYKPLYGFVLSEYTHNYDYWGYCDLDMLFGDIRSFLERYKISNYDKFLPLGHLSFIRNEARVYKAISNESNPRFLEMVSSSNTIQFDELTGGINDIIKDSELMIFRKRVFADVSRLWKRIKLAEKYTESEDINYAHQLFYWSKGKVYRKFIYKGKTLEEEFMYIHLKKRHYQRPDFDFTRLQTVIITPNELKCYDSTINIDSKMIKTQNRYYGKFYEFIEMKLLWHLKGHIEPWIRKVR